MDKNQKNDEINENQTKYDKQLCEYELKIENIEQKLMEKEKFIVDSKITTKEKDKHFEELKQQFNTMTKQNIEQFNELQKIREELQKSENKS